MMAWVNSAVTAVLTKFSVLHRCRLCVTGTGVNLVLFKSISAAHRSVQWRLSPPNLQIRRQWLQLGPSCRVGLVTYDITVKNNNEIVDDFTPVHNLNLQAVAVHPRRIHWKCMTSPTVILTDQCICCSWQWWRQLWEFTRSRQGPENVCQVLGTKVKFEN